MKRVSPNRIIDAVDEVNIVSKSNGYTNSTSQRNVLRIYPIFIAPEY